MKHILFDILYQDEHLVAVNKPHGLLVHRSWIAADAEVFAVQELRNQLDRHVYPCHRLDRKTGGVLLFALTEEMNSQMQQQFAQNKVKKTYHAVVRGFTPDNETIDYPLLSERGNMQDAITEYVTLKRIEVPVAHGKHTSSRYSLVEVAPQTGRMHQIRKHFAHIFHPIIGDRPHGCNKQNRLFKQNWGMDTMLLHARTLEFVHPLTNETINVEAEYNAPFASAIKLIWEELPKVDSI